MKVGYGSSLHHPVERSALTEQSINQEFNLLQRNQSVELANSRS
jgi:hypothetical protein